MYMGNATSQKFSVSMLSSGRQDIGITYEPSEQDQQNGEWQYNFDGDWHSLSKAPSRDKKKAIKLYSNAWLRYVPRESSKSYGLRVLNFFPFSSMDKNGAIADIPSLVSFEIALLLVHPVPVPSGYSLVHHSSSTKKIEVQEDGFFSKGLPIASLVHVHVPIPMLKNPVPLHMLPFVDARELKMFEHSVKTMEKSRPVAVVKTDVKDKGSLHISFPAPGTDGGVYILPTDDYYVPLDYANASLLFVPKKNYHGSFSVDLEICNCLAVVANTTSTNNNNITTLSIAIDVVPINDQPEVTSPLLYMPVMPYENATVKNDGYRIGDLISGRSSSGKFAAKDVETSSADLGIAIFTIPQSQKYGKWQYQNLVGGSWRDIVIAQNEVNPFVLMKSTANNQNQQTFGGVNKPTMNIEKNFYTKDQVMQFNSISAEKTAIEKKFRGVKMNLHLLNATQRIRFQLAGDLWWRRSDAMKSAILGFTVWDRSDGWAPGLYDFLLFLLNSSFYIISTKKCLFLVFNDCNPKKVNYNLACITILRFLEPKYSLINGSFPKRILS